MKDFKKNGTSYKQQEENENRGKKWQAFYATGETAVVMIYKIRATRKFILESFDDINRGIYS